MFLNPRISQEQPAHNHTAKAVCKGELRQITIAFHRRPSQIVQGFVPAGFYFVLQKGGYFMEPGMLPTMGLLSLQAERGGVPNRQAFSIEIKGLTSSRF